MQSITYSRVGDYLLPDIMLTEPPLELVKELGRYGCMRRAFLKEHHPIQYNTLLLTEQLFPHLREVQQTAHERVNSIMSDMLSLSPPPDKAADGLEWARHMTKLRRIAEKMMLDEVMYA